MGSKVIVLILVLILMGKYLGTHMNTDTSTDIPWYIHFKGENHHICKTNSLTFHKEKFQMDYFGFFLWFQYMIHEMWFQFPKNPLILSSPKSPIEESLSLSSSFVNFAIKLVVNAKKLLLKADGILFPHMYSMILLTFSLHFSARNKL